MNPSELKIYKIYHSTWNMIGRDILNNYNTDINDYIEKRLKYV